MRRLRLSTLLFGLNVGLLVAAVGGVAFIAIRFLRQLADDQGLARVALAGASARNEVTQSGQTMLTSAQLLGERSTLLGLLQADDGAALATYLAQFQETGRLDGSSVLLDDRVVAQSGLPLDWPAIWGAHRQESDYFIHAPPGGGPLLLVAWSPVTQQPGGVVVVAVQLGDSVARRISGEIGLPVAIVNPPFTPAGDPLTVLRAQALSSGESLTGRLTDPDQYVAEAPLRSPGGGVVGLVETRLDAADLAQSLGRLVQTLVAVTLAVGLLAAWASLYVGRRLSLPLRGLTSAADRIGHGDLATAVPPAPGLEMGTLSATLEDMRRRLLNLTADLRRRQAESDAILTGIVEGVFTVDRERRIRYLNPQAAALLGLSQAEAVGRFCGDVLNPRREDGSRPCEEQCPIVHARFRAGARATEHLLLPGGRRRSVVVTSAPPSEDQAAPGGAGLGQVQVMRDETEEEATRRLRDAVLANISHEFKTPLSAQLASIELLLDQLPDLTTGQIAGLVVSLQRGTLRLTQLIDNLLESVRIEAGRSTIRQSPVAVDEVIEQALEMTRPLIVQRGQAVVLELPYPLPPLSGDPARLTQVFVNLLANANKFSPPGSTIRIGGSADSEAVKIWVQDQGPGLPSDDGSMFVPFVRSPDEEPEAKGVGLGLWIVKSIVERHGGRVEADSGPLGTRLSVRLPLGGSHGE